MALTLCQAALFGLFLNSRLRLIHDIAGDLLHLLQRIVCNLLRAVDRGSGIIRYAG